MDDGRGKSEIGDIASMATVAGAFIGASSGSGARGGFFRHGCQTEFGEDIGDLLSSAAIS